MCCGQNNTGKTGRVEILNLETNVMTLGMSIVLLSTDTNKKACTWLRGFSSCSCLASLPGLAWALHTFLFPSVLIWFSISGEPIPEVLRGHSALTYDSKIVIMGGTNAANYYNLNIYE